MEGGPEESDTTPLMYAASGGNLLGVKILLERGADACAKDAQGRTALFWLLSALHADEVYLSIAEQLLEHGASAEESDVNHNASDNRLANHVLATNFQKMNLLLATVQHF